MIFVKIVYPIAVGRRLIQADQAEFAHVIGQIVCYDTYN